MLNYQRVTNCTTKPNVKVESQTSEPTGHPVVMIRHGSMDIDVPPFTIALVNRTPITNKYGTDL